MFQETTLTANGIDLHVAMGPNNGPRILLLHGVLRQWADFSSVVPAMLPRWQVCGLDFRGHGRSAANSTAYRAVDYVEDAVACIDHLADETPIVLFGHSLGAMVALSAAAERPERVRAAILEDPPFETMGRRLAGSAFERLFAGLLVSLESTASVKELTRTLIELPLNDSADKPLRLGDVRDHASLRWTAACLRQIDPEVLRTIVNGQWFEGYDFATSATAPCPTLLLQADTKAGGMLTNQDGRRLEAELAECYRIRFPGKGHLLHATATNAMLGVVLPFLDSVREGT